MALEFCLSEERPSMKRPTQRYDARPSEYARDDLSTGHRKVHSTAYANDRDNETQPMAASSFAS